MEQKETEKTKELGPSRIAGVLEGKRNQWLQVQRRDAKSAEKTQRGSGSGLDSSAARARLRARRFLRIGLSERLEWLGVGDGSDIGAYEADPNLRSTGIEKAGTDIRLRFNTMLDRSYAVESGDEITGPWNVHSNYISGDGASAQAVDAGGATLPRRFYRGVRLP